MALEAELRTTVQLLEESNHVIATALDYSQARVKRLEAALRQIRQLCVSGSPTRHLIEAALAEGDSDER